VTIGSIPHDAKISESLKGWLERLKQEVVRQRRPIFIPVTQFSDFSSLTFTPRYGEMSVALGEQALEEINSLGIFGARIDAIGDAYNHLFYVPKDFNVNTNIKFEIVWTTNSSDTGESATWGLKYAAIAEGEELADATVALDELIDADSVLGTYKVAISPYGLLYKDMFNHGDFVHLKVTLDAVSGLDPATDEVYLLGILINDQG
jgi:hypothetical protein